MSFVPVFGPALFGGGQKPPPPPPPPPNAPTLAQPSIAEQGAAARASLQGAEGAGLNGTDVTGGSGAPPPTTTNTPAKTLLGG